MMAISVEKNNEELLVKTNDSLANNTLSNKEILRSVIENIDEQTSKIVITTDYLKKEYDARILIDLPKLKTKEPVEDYLRGRKELENSLIITEAKKIMKKGMTPSDIYNKLFVPKITPAFIKSEVLTAPKESKLINTYTIENSKVNILNNKGTIIYELIPRELSCEYETIREVAKTLKEIEQIDLDITEITERISGIIGKKELSDEVKSIIRRHSIGLGVIDILLKDDKLQDIYLYSSGGTLHVTHSDYGDCDTNIKLSKKEIDGIATKIRVVSGRPFDESFPVIDYELKDNNARICGVMEPLTYKGTGYAFRKHKNSPWSIEDFIENKMITKEVAGLLSFLVDGQCSILVSGPRGSGKTSLLAALISEVPINQRIIAIEDTPELPIDELTKAGYKIQHLRVKPHLKDKSLSYELSPEEALRTSLRLGESVLVIGEVRGTEAKTLFEAMRVGAAGNVVMGTIHGSTVYDTFDRIVNDLGVPPTSFKSTDIIITCSSLRRGESLTTDRRVTSVTEVKKDWTENPMKENGLTELTIFDHKKKIIKLSPKINNSETIKTIAKLKGLSTKDCLSSIKLRGLAKELIIKSKIRREAGELAVINLKINELLNGNKKNFKKELIKYLKQYL